MSGARTEEPTAARLRRAREEGDSGASVYASQAIALVAAIALLPATVAAVGARVAEQLRDAIQRAGSADPTGSLDAAGLAREVAVLSLPLAAGVAITTIAASLVQTGGLVTTSRARRRAREGGGLGALLSRARLFAVARGLAGGAFVGWALLRALRAYAPDLARTSGRVALAMPAATTIALALAWQVALAGLALAALDMLVNRSLWRARLRMSRDEVRRERREAEGDPFVREARESAREEMVAGGAAVDVALARVVVRAGTGVACALRYEDGDRAPVVVATGEGEAAEQIVRAAFERRIAVREDDGLARALGTTHLRAGDPIPERLYDAVAQVLRDVEDAPE